MVSAVKSDTDLESLNPQNVELSDAQQERAHRASSVSWITPMTLLNSTLSMVMTIIFVHLMQEDHAFYGLVVPSQPHSMMGFALGFLLVFRSQIAYSRFWEARGHVGGYLKCCRSIAILSTHVTPTLTIQAGAEHEKIGIQAFRVELARLLILSIKVMNCSLLGKPITSIPLGAMLHPDEASMLESVPSPTLLVVKWITKLLEQQVSAGRMDRVRGTEFTKEISDMVGSYSGATKIDGTPFPAPYKQLANSFLFIWTMTLPILLAYECKTGTYVGPAAAFLLSFVYYSLNEIAVQMEDPYGSDAHDLPLAVMAESAAKDISALMDEDHMPSYI